MKRRFFAHLCDTVVGGRPACRRCAFRILATLRLCSTIWRSAAGRFFPDPARALTILLLAINSVHVAHSAEPNDPRAQQAEAKFELADGDCVVLLGDTLIEREQKYGYLEAGMLSRFPGRKITVRNLGRSGDTVWGDARVGFGAPADGLKHLKEEVIAAKPTVILVAYGANESFAGPAGLDRFCAGLNTLLGALSATGARIILLSPLRQENFGPPLPDPTDHNQDLQQYTAAIADVATQRHLPFVNLFNSIVGGGSTPLPPGARMTDNGIHLAAWGYWRATPKILAPLGLPEYRWAVDIDGQAGKVLKTEGTEVLDFERTADAIRFRTRDQMLSDARPPAETPEMFRVARAAERSLRVSGLVGTWALAIDGKQLDDFSGDDWTVGIVDLDGPEFDQAERLRRQIVAKDELVFHRWRPQNDVYLVGMRKHEQGNNAAEITQLDPLIASKEARIRELTIPAEHQYELIKK